MLDLNSVPDSFTPNNLKFLTLFCFCKGAARARATVLVIRKMFVKCMIETWQMMLGIKREAIEKSLLIQRHCERGLTVPYITYLRCSYKISLLTVLPTYST